ncbi:MAG: GDYXXLXY domain-containing protein, partial [Chitinophagales bacterium]
MTKINSLYLLLAVALVQLYVPAKMVVDNETIVRNGTVHKFKTAPIDPSDPFRGRYILLNFEASSVNVINPDEWDNNEEVFLQLTHDESGFSEIAGVSKTLPDGISDFVKAKVSYVTYDSIPKIMIDYPFARFYMEESKAPKAEEIVFKAAIDTNSITYAIVYIKNGTAVVTDVMVNNHSLKELAT